MVTSKYYITMIFEFFLPKLHCHQIIFRIWFQKDQAIVHTSHASIAWQTTSFPGRLILLWVDILWLPHSLELPLWDFYLSDYLKGKVYLDKLRTLAELWANIESAISISCILERVIANIPNWLEQCMENCFITYVMLFLLPQTLFVCIVNFHLPLNT